MCGRYSIAKPREYLVKRFKAALQQGLDFKPRYNMAPSLEAPVVLQDDSSRILTSMVWGIRPKTPNRGLLTNLRTDTLAKGTMRKHLLDKRCLVIADGFYEWRTEGRLKIPVRFTLKDDNAFGFPAIWDEFATGDKTIRAFTIFTTEPNDLVASTHDRMPVILPPEVEDTWLNPETRDADTLLGLLLPYPASMMIGYEVSREINRAENDHVGLIKPFNNGASQKKLF